MAEGKFTRNASIEKFCNVISRYEYELYKSGSSGQGSAVSERDRENFQKYVQDLNAQLDMMIAEPRVYLPQTVNRKMWAVNIPDVPHDNLELENDNVKMCIRHLELCRGEAVDCESSSQGSSINSFDERTLRDALTWSEKFLNDYLGDADIQPVPLPKSTPRNISTGIGRQGIN